MPAYDASAAFGTEAVAEQSFLRQVFAWMFLALALTTADGPTIKVPAGYRFTVRVNRDILFEAPYEPVQPQGRQPSQIPAK